MEDKELNTYGFNLEEILKEARENGNEEFANEAERILKENPQAVYDVIAQKPSCTAGEKLWNIDAQYLRDYLNNQTK